MNKLKAKITAKSVSILCGIMLICIVAYLVLEKEKPVLSSPEYPVSIDTINYVIDETNYLDKKFTVILEEDPFGNANISNFTFIGKDEKLLFGLNSSKTSKSKFLGFTVTPFYNDNAISINECKETLVFAALLFGDFNYPEQLYDTFIKEYSTCNTEKKVYDIVESNIPQQYISECSLTWKTKINNTICEINIVQPRLNSAEAYIRTFSLLADVK